MTSFDRPHEIFRAVIDTWNDVCESLGIGSPKNDYLIEIILSLESSTTWSAFALPSRMRSQLT